MQIEGMELKFRTDQHARCARCDFNSTRGRFLIPYIHWWRFLIEENWGWFNARLYSHGGCSLFEVVKTRSPEYCGSVTYLVVKDHRPARSSRYARLSNHPSLRVHTKMYFFIEQSIVRIGNFLVWRAKSIYCIMHMNHSVFKSEAKQLGTAKEMCAIQRPLLPTKQ